jgi:hypothetical protein
MRSQHVLFTCALFIGVLGLPGVAEAKSKKVKSQPKDPQDTIEVLGHIPLTGGPVTRFMVTRHYSRDYLYVEHEGGKSVTLLDISNAEEPAVLSDVSYPSGGTSENLFAVAGTAVLTVESSNNTPALPTSQTVRIMDFSDPQHPKVAREFTGVTAMSRDDQRGLIFLANADGFWILHQELALDPEMLQQWVRQVSAP